MKIKLLATSIAALGCSFASAQQAQVTVYGNLDVGISTQSTSATGYATNVPGNTANKGTLNRLQDGGIGGSNFGLKGSADIGGGLKSSFQLQGNANVDTGAGSATSGTITPSTALFNQTAKVALSGEFGEISLGRQVAPMYIALGYTDAREARYSGSILSAFVGMNSSNGWAGGTTNAPMGAIYDDNAVIYVSPTINGMTASLEYSFGEIPGNANAGSRVSATLLYANPNGLRLSAAVYNGYDSYTLPANANGTLNNQFYHLGALYAFDQYTVSASYSKGKNPSGLPAGVGVVSAAAPTLGQTTPNADYDITSVGFGYKISPEYRVTSGYYNLRDNTNNANTSGLFALGLDRYLDKSTMLYALLGRVSNQGTMNQAIIYGSPVGAGVETTAFMVGVRRSF